MNALSKQRAVIVAVAATAAAFVLLSGSAQAAKMYFDSGGSIFRANLDGTGVESIALDVSTPGVGFAVAVDPLAGKLYWPNNASPVFDQLTIANLDGSGRATALFRRTPG
jgi:hypothetical protein